MDRLVRRSAKCCIGPYLTRRAFATVALGVLCVGIAHSQVGVESAILTNNVAAPDKSLKMAANGLTQLTIGSPISAEVNRDSASKGLNCTGPMRSYSEVTVPVGKSMMVQLPEPVRSRTVDNPNVVQAMLVSPQALYVPGPEMGSTNMIVQGRSGSCSVVDVIVGADPGGLQSMLCKLIPEARNVQVSTAADSLVLGGSVSDFVQAQKVVDIASASVMRRTRSPNEGDQNATGQGGQQLHTAGPGAPLRSPRIINMMTAEAPQQVILEVKVAGASKTLIDQMGAAFDANGTFDSWSFGVIANFLSGSSDIINFSKANHLSFKSMLDAQEGDSLVRVLAEPSLMAISGQEASFLAGGKVFIPVVQGAAANGVATIVLQEETFGTGLRFAPTAMENGRINLKVSPEVSELSPIGMAVTTLNSSNISIPPLITTCRASITLQVYDGQNFAIGGLIRNNITGSLKALPSIDELPIIDSLARSTSFQQDQTELLFVVTSRLVKPLPAQYPLPTDNFGTINHGELYFDGNVKSHVQTPAGQPTAVAALAVNPEKATAGSAAAPGPSTQAPTPINVPVVPATPVTPVAPTASTAPRDTRRFIATGEQSTGN